MPSYEADDIEFEADSSTVQAVTETEGKLRPTRDPYPPAKIKISKENEEKLSTWLDTWLESLISAQQSKITQWVEEERDYRAKTKGPQQTPFVGACGDVVPAIAMAVDPIHARLDTGIFKADPVVVMKGIRKSILSYIPALEHLVEYYQKHRVQLRRVASPRILECTKHGTMMFKTVYDRDTSSILTYDSSWKVSKQTVTRFSGPRTTGISINDFFFPPYFQHVQDCPIVAERFRASYEDLRVAEESKKLTDCAKVLGQEMNLRTEFEEERAISANHQDPIFRSGMMLELFECWFKYDIDNDGIPESMVATYHRPTQTFLQLRYNWYFHQRYPYTVIPYAITNDSIYGLGICEMVKPFQDMLTKWHRLAQDNAYLSNIVMFIARKDSGIEANPSLYGGRTFFVDDPTKDFKPFRAGDTYNSTLQERQNLFGLAEKRTGVSDYLTGRESPIVGSRATATSTLALIQEGTRRVEEVLENIRNGLTEIIEMWFYIWFQYGLDGLDDMVFADDETGIKIKDFFDNVKVENINGAFAVDLTATDAANNRSVQQQLQLSIIQVMMNYLEKVLQAGSNGLQAIATMPEYTEMVGEVMTASRKMFRDLLQKYDIRNPDDYLPDLEKFLQGKLNASRAVGEGAQGGAEGVPGGMGGGGAVPNVAPSPTRVEGPEVPASAASSQFRGSIPSAGGVFGS